MSDEKSSSAASASDSVSESDSEPQPDSATVNDQRQPQHPSPLELEPSARQARAKSMQQIKSTTATASGTDERNEQAVAVQLPLRSRRQTETQTESLTQSHPQPHYARPISASISDPGTSVMPTTSSNRQPMLGSYEARPALAARRGDGADESDNAAAASATANQSDSSSQQPMDVTQPAGASFSAPSSSTLPLSQDEYEQQSDFTVSVFDAQGRPVRLSSIDEGNWWPSSHHGATSSPARNTRARTSSSHPSSLDSSSGYWTGRDSVSSNMESGEKRTLSRATTATSTPRRLSDADMGSLRRGTEFTPRGELVPLREEGVEEDEVEKGTRAMIPSGQSLSMTPTIQQTSVIPCILISLFGGCIYGYNTAIIAGLSTPLIDHQFFSDRSPSSRASFNGLLTASILIGGLIGTALSVPLSNRVGRKISFIVCGCICVIGAVGMGVLGQAFAALVALRALLGVSVGMTATLCPLYNAEVSPVEKRGMVGTVYQISVVFSILLAEVINFAFNPSNNPTLAPWKWQVQFILGATFGTALVALAIMVPESGVWKKYREKKKEKRRRQLSRRRSTSVAGETATPLEQQRLTSEPPPNRGWRGLFHVSNLRWLSLAWILAISNQLTGINAVIFYAPKIFTEAGFESQALVLTVAVVGTWNLIAVLFSLPLIRKYSRRHMMLGALLIMASGMALISIVHASIPSRRAIPSIVAILLFILGFEVGPGPLFFILAAEAFPTHILHAGLNLSNQCAWLFNILVTFCFPLLTQATGSATTFGIFCIICLATCAALYFLLPLGVEHHVIQSVEGDASASASASASPLAESKSESQPQLKKLQRLQGGIELTPSPVVEHRKEPLMSPPYQAKDREGGRQDTNV